MSELDLEREYHAVAPLAQQLCATLTREVGLLLSAQGIPLGVPIESRVKTWESIADKVVRQSLPINSIVHLPDLVGVRLVLLFLRDVDKTCDIISSTFKVLRTERKQDDLGDDKFGYLSVHFDIQLPQEWLALPSLSSMNVLQAEIQVRTMAQHIWAAASHFLQYRKESSVPSPVRRSIHRVSALLETIDLEFERVLDDRQIYSQVSLEKLQSEKLNVDLLARLLDESLPHDNKGNPEAYAELLRELMHFGVTTPTALRELVSSYIAPTLAHDKERVKSERNGKMKTNTERLARGVFFTHTGLVRHMLRMKFGEAYTTYQMRQTSKSTASTTKKASAARDRKT